MQAAHKEIGGKKHTWLNISELIGSNMTQNRVLREAEVLQHDYVKNRFY